MRFSGIFRMKTDAEIQKDWETEDFERIREFYKPLLTVVEKFPQTRLSAVFS